MKPMILLLCLIIIGCVSVPHTEEQRNQEKPEFQWIWIGLGILTLGVLVAALNSEAEPSDGDSYRCRENIFEEVICDPI